MYNTDMETITPEMCITKYQECVQMLNANWDQVGVNN